MDAIVFEGVECRRSEAKPAGPDVAAGLSTLTVSDMVRNRHGRFQWQRFLRARLCPTQWPALREDIGGIRKRTFS